MPSYSDARIVCRPAVRLDTEDVLEFTKYIWEGHDYIKYVWREWLDDPQGLVAAAQYGPRTVGIAKVTLLSPGQWWLEGLRVDPQYQGLGIGSHLHAYTDGWWLRHGDGTIRLMTSSQRVQVHHLSERTGYIKVGEVAGYGLDLSNSTGVAGREATGLALGHAEGSASFELVDSNRLGEARDFAAAHLSQSNGLMDSGWRFLTPDVTALGAFARHGHLHWWRGGQGLLAAFEDDEDAQRVLAIGFAAVSKLTLLPGLLRDTAGLARQQGFTAVHWLAPVQAEVEAALAQAGYVLDWEHSGYLYAKSHPSA